MARRRAAAACSILLWCAAALLYALPPWLPAAGLPPPCAQRPPAPRPPSHISLTLSLAPMAPRAGLEHPWADACYSTLTEAVALLAPALRRLARDSGVHGGVQLTTRVWPAASGIARLLAPAEEVQVLSAEPAGGEAPTSGGAPAAAPVFALHSLRAAAALDAVAHDAPSGGATRAWGDAATAAVWLALGEGAPLMVDFERCACRSTVGRHALCDEARLLHCSCDVEAEKQGKWRSDSHPGGAGDSHLACLLPRGAPARVVAAELLLLLPPEALFPLWLVSEGRGGRGIVGGSMGSGDAAAHWRADDSVDALTAQARLLILAPAAAANATSAAGWEHGASHPTCGGAAPAGEHLAQHIVSYLRHLLALPPLAMGEGLGGAGTMHAGSAIEEEVLLGAAGEVDAASGAKVRSALLAPWQVGDDIVTEREGAQLLRAAIAAAEAEACEAAAGLRALPWWEGLELPAWATVAWRDAWVKHVAGHAAAPGGSSLEKQHHSQGSHPSSGGGVRLLSPLQALRQALLRWGTAASRDAPPPLPALTHLAAVYLPPWAPIVLPLAIAIGQALCWALRLPRRRVAQEDRTGVSKAEDGEGGSASGLTQSGAGSSHLSQGAGATLPASGMPSNPVALPPPLPSALHSLARGLQLRLFRPDDDSARVRSLYAEIQALHGAAGDAELQRMHAAWSAHVLSSDLADIAGHYACGFGAPAEGVDPHKWRRSRFWVATLPQADVARLLQVREGAAEGAGPAAGAGSKGASLAAADGTAVAASDDAAVEERCPVIVGYVACAPFAPAVRSSLCAAADVPASAQPGDLGPAGASASPPSSFDTDVPGLAAPRDGSPATTRTCELLRLVVDARCARLGIGAALVSHVEAWAAGMEGGEEVAREVAQGNAEPSPARSTPRGAAAEPPPAQSIPRAPRYEQLALSTLATMRQGIALYTRCGWAHAGDVRGRPEEFAGVPIAVVEMWKACVRE